MATALELSEIATALRTARAERKPIDAPTKTWKSKIFDLNLSNMRGVLRFNGTEVMSGNTRNVLGNPLAGVAWLVNRLAAYDIQFEPGQVILPGSCLEAVPMDKPGHWSCEFEGWGTIEFDAV
ncbi:hypothetical protein N7528_004653 [Penicillium herquei]|nr:hypothetical protein N7528_004653 [Penicillium herquei]